MNQLVSTSLNWSEMRQFEMYGNKAPGDDRVRLLGAIIDHLPVMVGYWDRDCRNVVASSAYLEWLGVKPQDMPGMHVRDVLGETVYEMNKPYIEGVLTGRQQSFERTLVDVSGRTRHTHATYIPDVDGNEVMGFFVFVAEITEQVEAEKAAHEAAEQYRALARNLPGSFVMTFDPDLRYLVADGQALTVLGLSSGQIEGHRLQEVFPDRASEMEKCYKSALAGLQVTWEEQISSRTLSFTAGPVRDEDGKVFAGMVIGRDVTVSSRRQLRESILRSIAAATAAGESVEQIGERVADGLIRLFGSLTAVVVRFVDDQPTVLVQRPPLQTVVPNESLSYLGEGSAAGMVQRTGHPEYVRYLEHPVAFPIVEEAGIKVGAAAPIMAHGKMWGSIGVGLGTEEDDPDEIMSSIASFADAVATSISSVAAWQALTEMATLDPLTGLANRRAFDEFMNRELAAGARRESQVSLILIDLDDFKSINDQLGHQVGDITLKNAARRLAAITRTDELLARIGGDEFALVARPTNSSEAAAAANRIWQALNTPDAECGTIPASIGAATSLPGVTDADALFHSADSALYESKRRGRNTVTALP